MKVILNFFAPLFFLFALSALLTGCAVVGGIFKAGFWSGIILVIVVVGGLIWLIGRAGRGGNNA
jgi:hypothetical protein